MMCAIMKRLWERWETTKTALFPYVSSGKHRAKKLKNRMRKLLRTRICLCLSYNKVLYVRCFISGSAKSCFSIVYRTQKDDFLRTNGLIHYFIVVSFRY